MKRAAYIFLFVILGFLGKSLALPAHCHSRTGFSKEISLDKSEKHADLLKYADFVKKSAHLKKERRPKKPKGIPVIIPNVSSHIFQKFCHYSDLNAHEVKGSYSLLLHYSHGKRGPPGNRG